MSPVLFIALLSSSLPVQVQKAPACLQVYTAKASRVGDKSGKPAQYSMCIYTGST